MGKREKEITVEVWEGDKSITVFEKGHGHYANGERYHDCKKLLREIKGKDWNDCMRQHHELMGWEPYKPIV